MNVISLINRIPEAKVRFAALAVGLVALECGDGWMLAMPDGCTVIAGDDEYGVWSGEDVVEYSWLFQEGQRTGVYIV